MRNMLTGLMVVCLLASSTIIGAQRAEGEKATKTGQTTRESDTQVHPLGLQANPSSAVTFTQILLSPYFVLHFLAGV